ncbi:MAG TPA: tRNA adenosine(34) deaminase TadA [candidate division Zixibacteria bacterium]|nr:tRNA adenosine(34) deaminase TadA [candidate division Zixibacteria bacterium]MDM7973205.1 tRNA adenosine(34) deaminase TadA [candidate division Zixibacteria bacterium]HOD67062.1 tRNA adenosine(34) deaminase TadA [candidate division Zixibacteria bacterium]
MRLALREAEQAFEEGEVPVGAVVVQGDRVIGRGANRTVHLHDATAHAEMIALTAAANALGDWRLEGCELYCTLEPCAMCAGAAVLSRIERIVFGSRDPKFGACGSIFLIPGDPRLNHRAEIVEGVLADAAAELMRAFFQRLRQAKGEEVT